MNLPPLSTTPFIPFVTQGENALKSEESSTEKKTKRVSQSSLTGNSKKKGCFAPHPLDFLVTRFNRPYLKDCLSELETMMGKVFLPPAFLKDFEIAYKTIFSKIPPGLARIHLLKNLLSNADVSSSYELKELEKLALYLEPYCNTYSHKNLFRIQDFFIGYAQDSWVELSECLKIFHESSHDLATFLRFTSCLSEVFRARWLEFTHFFVDYCLEDTSSDPSFMNFFSIFDQNQIKKLLTDTTVLSRKILFQDSLQPAEQGGLEFLANSCPQLVKLFFKLVQELEIKDLRLHSRFLFFPLVLGLKDSLVPYETLQMFLAQLSRFTWKVDQFIFFIDKAVNMHPFRLDGCHHPLLPHAFGPFCSTQFPLMQHLYHYFRLNNDMVIKKVFAEALSTLIDEEEESIVFQSELELNVVSQFATSLTYFFHLNPEVPNKIEESDPLFSFLAKQEIMLCCAWNYILVKDKEYFSQPLSILKMLLGTHGSHLEDLQFLFIPSEPIEIEGKKRFMLPPTEDLGGPTRQFYFKLLQSFFVEGSDFRFTIDEQGFISSDPEEKEECSKNLFFLGKLLSLLLENRIPTGPLFNPMVYMLMKKIKFGGCTDLLTKYREVDFLVYGDRLLNYQQPTDQELQKIRTFLCLNEDDDLENSVLEMLKSQHDPRLHAATMILSGLSTEHQFMIRSLPIESIQEEIEGVEINPKTISRLCYFKRPFEEASVEGDENQALEEIESRLADSESKTLAFQSAFEKWITNASVKQRQAFMVATTGSPSFYQDEVISIHFQKSSNNSNVHKETNCVIHTCSKTLEIFMDDPADLHHLLDQITQEKCFNIV